MTKTKIKIEAIHDVVCSWCPIGYSNLKNALNRLESEVEAHITYLPFELNPDMPEEGETIANYFKRRQRWSSATLKDYQESLVKTAQSAGVVIDFSKRTHYYNSRKAHKLIHWAEQFNKQTAVNESLIEAYFKQGLDISNTDILLDIAEQLGMDRVSTQNGLLSRQLELALEKKIERQKAFKLQSIPAFIISEDTLVSGSNSVEFFEKTLSECVDVLSLNKKIAI